MPQRQIAITDVPSHAGEELGKSDWFTVTQEAVNAFADATHDHQWIHVDVERANRESPFGGPIAHGYYTLSLFPHLISQIWTVTGLRGGINYGLNRLRFPAPVLVGSRLRASCKLDSAEDVPGGMQVQVITTIELEGNPKPACVAECLFRYFT